MKLSAHTAELIRFASLSLLLACVAGCGGEHSSSTADTGSSAPADVAIQLDQHGDVQDVADAQVGDAAMPVEDVAAPVLDATMDVTSRVDVTSPPEDVSTDAKADVAVAPACETGERKCDADGRTVLRCGARAAGGADWTVWTRCTGTPCEDGACGAVPLVDGEVGPEGGELLVELPEPEGGVAGVRLVIPAGAVSEPVVISIAEEPGPAFSSGDVPPVSVHIGPSGLQFAEPAELTLTYDEAAMEEAGWLGPEFVQAMTYDEVEGAWVPLRQKSVDPVARTVTAELDGLSYKALVTPVIYPNVAWSVTDYPGRPVLLVHGLQIDGPKDAGKIAQGLAGSTGTRGALSPESENLLSTEPGKVPVYEIRYYTTSRIEVSACALKSALSKILGAHPAYKGTGVTVLAHSLGGLVSRAYTVDMGWYYEPGDAVGTPCPYDANDAGIHRLLTFGTPHGGSGWAKLSSCWIEYDFCASDQMIPESDFLTYLNYQPIRDLGASGPEYQAFIGKDDSVVAIENGKLWPQVVAPDVDKKAHFKNDVELEKLEHEGSWYGIVNLSSKDEQWHKPVYDAMCEATEACAPTCKPECSGKECGDDGCGGTCAPGCGAEEVCDGGVCIAVSTCGDITPTGTCTEDVLTYCAGGALQQEDCGTSGMTCGWSATYASWTCVEKTCTPACVGKECGDDGCGGTCAPGCKGTETCNDGVCVAGQGGCWPNCPEMVDVPAGPFWMGCNEAVDTSCDGDEYPYHEVTLSAYQIDATEVTADAYKACVTAGGCTVPDNWSSYCTYGASGKGQHPVNCVDWYQSEAYCTWSGKRLCTEAEWEKAARGTDGRKYPWGNEAASCEFAVFSSGGSGCGTDSTWPVGSKPKGASPYGAVDMAGNVWEWTADWYGGGYYTTSPTTNPKALASGSNRVLRGGSFDYGYASYLRASYRAGHDPSDTNDDLGLRCCRSTP